MIEDNEVTNDQLDDAGVIIEDISDVELEPVVVDNSTAHDDYDWSMGKRNTLKYDEADHKRYFEQYDQSLNSVAEDAL